MSNAAVPVFYSYAHEDETFRIELAKQLKILERTGIISGWSDRDIGAGEDWRNTISENLKDAKIVLLLVSPDFLASDYCYEVEMSYALGRHNRGEAIVIPVFLRKTLFELAPFAKLQGLPKDAKAITDWLNRDDAFAEIAAGIQQAAERIRNKNTGAAKDVGPEWNKSVEILPRHPRQRQIQERLQQGTLHGIDIAHQATNTFLNNFCNLRQRLLCR